MTTSAKDIKLRSNMNLDISRMHADVLTEQAEETKVTPDDTVLRELAECVSEERQVVVHCTFKAPNYISSIRIWKTTFLIPRESDQRCHLMNAFNISYFPIWTAVPAGSSFSFTLLFSGLPKDCQVFDLIEDIPQSGGFEYRGIKRNKTDIYNIIL